MGIAWLELGEMGVMLRDSWTDGDRAHEGEEPSHNFQKGDDFLLF